MRAFLLLLFLIISTVCDITYAKEVQEDLFYVYDNITLESFCHQTKKVLYCDERNDSSTFSGDGKFDNVKFCLEFPKVLKRNKLLHGKETAIKVLMFFNNSITYIEDETFDVFILLKSLQFRHTNLNEITEKYLTKSLGLHLNSLALGYNNITFISSLAFQFMINLTYLGLEGNANLAKYINNGLFSKSLSKLDTLNLVHCNIINLNDDVFVELKNLQLLSLSGNPFISIPKAINTLPSIYYFAFDDTNITSLIYDKEVQNKALQVITISQSKNLIIMENCAFCSFPNLWSITMSCNQKLSKIDENVFGSKKDMPELGEVQMEKINRSIIPETLFTSRRIEIVLNLKLKFKNVPDIVCIN